MAKFYVESGSLREVLHGEDAAGAALTGLDRALERSRWVYDDPGLTDRQRRDHIACEALLGLDSEIRVSERGFGRAEARRFETADLVDHWHQMVLALRRLEAALEQITAIDRSLAAVAQPSAG